MGIRQAHTGPPTAGHIAASATSKRARRLSGITSGHATSGIDQPKLDAGHFRP